MGSKLNTDVLEALEFLATAQEFGLEGAREGVRKALVLVWSAEQTVRDALVATYIRLFLSSEDPSSSHTSIARNLLLLVNGATVGELASLEEMIVLLIKNEHLSDSVIQILWGVFAGKASWAGEQDAKYALLLLSMVGRVNSDTLRGKMQLLMKHGLQPSDLTTARYCCSALHRLASTGQEQFHPALPALPRPV